MKKLLIISALFALSLTGCGGDNPEPSGDVNWSQDIKEEMIEYLGLALPFVQFDQESFYHEWDAIDNAYYLGDYSPVNVLANYGAELLKAQWEPSLQAGSALDFTKTTTVGKLILHAEWYEETELEPCGNEIAVYVDEGGVVPPGGETVTGTYTFKMSDMGWSNLEDNPTVTAEPGLTIVTDKGGNTQSTGIPKYYETSYDLRLYALNTLTLSAEEITKIEFTCTFRDNQTMTPSVGTLADTVWTGSASSVTFTLGSKGQVRITELKVTGTFSGEGGSPIDPITPTGDYTPLSVCTDIDYWAFEDAEDSDMVGPDEDGRVYGYYTILWEDLGNTDDDLVAAIERCIYDADFPSYLSAETTIDIDNGCAYVYLATDDSSVAVYMESYYVSEDQYSGVAVYFEAAPYDYYGA